MGGSWTLVTGSNGFLAGHLIRALLEDGRRVKALVRGGADTSSLLGLPRESLRVAQGDVQIVDRVYAAMNGCDSVFHLAAPTSLSERDGAETERVALRSTEAVLEAGRRASLSRIVVVGCALSQAATAGPTLEPTAGAAVGRERNVQARSKRAVEKLALQAAERGQPVIVASPGLVVGARDARPSLGGAVVLSYLRQSLALPMPVVPGGAAWVGAADVARGLVQVLEQGRVGERYALGGENLTHRALLTKLSDLTGLAEPGEAPSLGRARFIASLAEFRARLGGGAPGITTALIDDYWGRYLYVNDEKARQELGYRPRPVGEALAESVRWYASNGYLPDANARGLRLDATLVS
ncbi:MAG TPA: NAD-dependent epimerase/dehydratase family protein [Polyangiaceae bacterium]|nr:NAD-dependent epimerase/dehydratase family protein [Polyangiaceae bacterium]